MSHSISINQVVSLTELKQHVAFNKKYPESLCFRYSYYEDNWGFSLTKSELSKLNKSHYRVVINSDFYNSSLKVAELTINGGSDSEIAFLSHLCHPGQYNDGLVGLLISLYLYESFKNKKTKYSYKFITFPETIGSTAYCSVNNNIKNIKSAIFNEMMAIDQKFSLQMSFNNEDYINNVIKCAFLDLGYDYNLAGFLKVIRNDEKILSDCCEALIGAIYLDRGFDFVENFILKKKWN